MVTHVLGLDRELEHLMQINNPTYRTIMISNVESYYNYRSFGVDFKLVSSILSVNNTLKDLTLIGSVDGDQATDSYEIVGERIVREEKRRLYSMVLDQRRLRSAIVMTNSEEDRPLTSSQAQYNAFFGENDDETEHIQPEHQLVQPMFCKDTSTAKKENVSNAMLFVLLT